MEKLKRRVILVGKGASGKDHLRKMLVDSGMKYCVSHTTRPRRTDENSGVDYYFVTMEEALSMKERDLFLETTVFNGWIYGTSREEFYRSDLFIMTPSGIRQLSEQERAESIVVLIDVPLELRKERLLKRRDADDVDRRIEADEIDFYQFEEFDYVLSDPHFADVPEFLVKFIKEKYD
jgi:guanylate kinase